MSNTDGKYSVNAHNVPNYLVEIEKILKEEIATWDPKQRGQFYLRDETREVSAAISKYIDELEGYTGDIRSS